MNTPDLESLARDFCKRNNFPLVSLVQSAMTEAAGLVVDDCNKTLKQLLKDIKTDRQEANKPK